MDRRAELERELRGRRDDYDLWHIYADHLAETGDELWANWILLNLAGERGGRDEQARQELRMAIGDRDIYGPELRALLTRKQGLQAMMAPRLEIITLEHGFVGHAVLVLSTMTTEAIEVAEHLRRGLDLFLGHPAARFLRRLDIRVWDPHGEDRPTELLLEALASHALESLRELSIEVAGLEEGLAPLERFARSTEIHANVFRAAPQLARFRIENRNDTYLVVSRDGSVRRIEPAPDDDD